MSSGEPFQPRVVKLVTDEELIIDLGFMLGAQEGDLYDVFDQETEDVTDPESGELLGSIPRRKSTVRITKVAEKISLAETTEPRFINMSPATQVMLGRTGTVSTHLTSDMWPDGVRVNDPVRRHQD